MGTNYLIDTNIVIYFLDGLLPSTSLPFIKSVFEGNYAISIITKIELLGWQFPDSSKMDITERFLDSSMISFLDNEVVEQTISLRRFYKIKLPDAIIAATAMTNDLTLLSRNDKDFAAISTLKYLNPFTLS